MNITKWFLIGLSGAVVAGGAVVGQDYEKIDGALIYDYDRTTKIGDDVFGTAICDFENDAPGRCSHGGPVCLEYANGTIVAFYANTSDHNTDGWSEYAVSKDRGQTWVRYHKFPYSYEVYQKDQKRPAWVEEGLVTQKGTVVCFITHFEIDKNPNNPYFEISDRIKSGMVRSYDNGITWTGYEPIDGSFVGYPCAVAVNGSTNYVLFDEAGDGRLHLLYASTDDGQSWSRLSVLPLDPDAWYGAMCLMEDGRLLAGAYLSKDENHFNYCISEDQGRTWTEQKRSYVDKKVRDPELAYIGGHYYLHGRSGSYGEGRNRFVLYQSSDGENWGKGIIISGKEQGPDGYSHNCIINKYDDNVPIELMVQYSIIYSQPRKPSATGRDTNEYVFFIKPDTK